MVVVKVGYSGWLMRLVGKVFGIMVMVFVVSCDVQSGLELYIYQGRFCLVGNR